MFMGLLLGFVISLFWIIIALIVEEEVSYDKEWIVKLALIIAMIGTTIFGGIIGTKLDIVGYNKKIANWENTKEVIEQSIKDENISDLEKINLIKTITEYNRQLTELKEDVKQWWYFYLDDRKVNELDIIRIGEE